MLFYPPPWTGSSWPATRQPHPHCYFYSCRDGVKIVYILCNSKPNIKVIHLKINHPCYEAPSKRNKIRACELELICWVQILLPSPNTFKSLTRIWSPRELLISFKSGELTQENKQQQKYPKKTHGICQVMALHGKTEKVLQHLKA